MCAERKVFDLRQGGVTIFDFEVAAKGLFVAICIAVEMPHIVTVGEQFAAADAIKQKLIRDRTGAARLI